PVIRVATTEPRISTTPNSEQDEQIVGDAPMKRTSEIPSHAATQAMSAVFAPNASKITAVYECPDSHLGGPATATRQNPVDSNYSKAEVVRQTLVSKPRVGHSRLLALALQWRENPLHLVGSSSTLPEGLKWDFGMRHPAIRESAHVILY